MLTFLLGFTTGLVVGWNFLPQPAFVRSLVEKARRRLSGDDPPVV